MLMASIDPICQLIERSLEAPVLGTVLDVVLGLTSVLPSEDVPTFLARVLPSAAKRLKQAAPQVCSWIVDQLRCMLWIDFIFFLFYCFSFFPQLFLNCTERQR